jgi:hypothetical protein
VRNGSWPSFLDLVSEDNVSWDALVKAEQTVELEAKKGKRFGVWVTAVGQLETRARLSPLERSGQDPVLGCVTNVSENLQSCIEDGRRPPGVDFQELASNHPGLLRSKGVVVNVRGKGVREGRQVSVEKMNES